MVDRPAAAARRPANPRPPADERDRNRDQNEDFDTAVACVRAVCQLAILDVYFERRSRHGFVNKIVQLLVIFPLTAVVVILKTILPKIDTFFSGIVVVARTPR